MEVKDMEILKREQSSNPAEKIAKINRKEE